MTKTKEKYLLAFIRISAGSSWYQAKDEAPELIALKAVKVAIRDWKHLFKFKKEGEWIVPIYDISKCRNGWQALNYPYGIFPILKSGKVGKKPCKIIKHIKLFY
tara:strand:+ start:305 stop:616 length:312 start_codon:yes stop_codon:yes gene_type:complete